MITRRSFLGAALMAVPAVRTLAALAPIKDLEAWLSLANSDFSLHLTSYTNGTLTAKCNGVTLTPHEDRGWLRFIGGAKGLIGETRVRHAGPGSIDVDWISFTSGDFTLMDDFCLTPKYHELRLLTLRL